MFRFFSLAVCVVLVSSTPVLAADLNSQLAETLVVAMQQVELIRAQHLYAAVHAVFMEEAPRIADCYTLAPTKNLVMVPFFISDGLHSYEDIPMMLGEPERVVRERLRQGQPTWRNPTEKQGKHVWYSSSIGSEPLLADVILERVRERAGVPA